jgi:phage/plasmid-like protein (TIGR03299 family)
MSHEVEKMVFAGATPWHGLGTEIDDATNFWDAFKLAGLDWEVETEPLYRMGAADQVVGEEVKAQAAVRTSDNKVLGVVGPRWTPLQNRDAFQVFEPLIDSGDMRLHTAGSLRGGERVWVLCQLGLENTEIVKNDEIAKFALLSNGHDGKLAVHFGFTPIRVVCANTESMARSSKASKLIRIRHHRFVKNNVEKLRDIMNLADQEFEATAEQYRFLASKQINATDLHKYVKIVLDVHQQEEDELSTRTKNIIGKVEEFFLLGKGNDLPGVNGTYWAAYNGVTEYLNYEKGRTNENRMDSLWFGQNGNLSQKALDTAVALAA